MSVNFSLAEMPGVSAFFDGQPIQDEVEAEIRREEERQEKELRNILATELEDFEEDFLSDSNSDDDSVNISRVSRASSTKLRQNENPKVFGQILGNMVDLDPDSVDRGSQHPTKESAQEILFTPLSHRHQPAFQNPQALLQNQKNLTHQHPNEYYEHHQQNINHPVSYVKDNDEWMMRVQPQNTALSSAPPYHQPSHQYQHQQQYFNTFPQSSAGMMSNPPLPIPSHLSHHVQPFQNSVTKSIPTQPSHTQQHIPSAGPSPHISSLPSKMPLENSSQNQSPIKDNSNEYDNYQVQYKTKLKGSDVNENDFYIQNENVEFFKAEGGEEKRTYQQLEILYRARGRELEDLSWKLKQAEEDAAKDARMYKHKLALNSGELDGSTESLRQCQSLFQQAKADLTESQGLVRMLETQVASLKEAKEELIKKLQVTEATLENLSHQCEELQQSESLSRARNEHESVVSSLTQRYERELFSVKEKWDETKTNLETKHEEVVWLKKQLAESTKELEQSQISRGETINRLAKSLEGSQRQCQALLEQSSSQEVASLKIKLQQMMVSKTISEESCDGLQSEVKELKEQLSMFQTASALGAVSTTHASSSHKVSGASLDDSMTDLGIKKTLDFDTPRSTPQMTDASSLEDLISSLRTELEKCLHNNRQKRSDIAQRAEEIESLKKELKLSQSKTEDLERICTNQKIRLTDLESLMSSSNGESILEARLRRDVDALAKEKAVLLEDIEDYKKRLEEVGASEAKLTEINTELSGQISQMVTDFDADKTSALDRCQRTLEEVHRLSMDSMRSELEGRLASEKNMLSECHKMELDRLKEQLDSAKEEAHSVKTLYIQTCDEVKKQEEEARSKMRKEVEDEMAAVSRCKEEAKELAVVEEEKKTRVCLEDNLEKEKEAWKQEKTTYENEIKASKEVIGELRSNHEKEMSSLQDIISNLESQHKEKMKDLEDKMQEKSDKIQYLENEWKNEMELIASRHQEEKEKLQESMQKVILKPKENCDLEKARNDVSTLTCVDVMTVFVQTEGYKCEGNGHDTEVVLRKQLAGIELDLKSTKEEHASFIEKLKSEHRKEFEKAARNREEKFQTELRYFLKNREEKSRDKLEQALRKCQDELKVEFEKHLEENNLKHKHEMEEFRKTISDSELGGNKVATKVMEDAISKLKEEKSAIERKMNQIENQKKEEVLELMERHAKEEKALIEKYGNEMELLTKRHKEECKMLHDKLKELEAGKDLSNDYNVACLWSEDEVDKLINARLQEERAKWFKDAQEYIKTEIETGIKERQSDVKFEEAVKEKVESELTKMNYDRKHEIEEEINARVKSKVDEEIKEIRAEREVKGCDTEKLINYQVKQKLSVEVENLKIKFLSELETRVAKEKTTLEQDVKKWKEEMKKKIDGDKEVLVSQMNKEMDEKISLEKRKVEEEMMQLKEDDLREMRQEMEDEMRKRIKKEKNDWQKELDNNGDAQDSEAAFKERLKVAEDACAKTFKEREQTVELMKKKEAAYKEERQKLIGGLKQLRHDFNTMKSEHEALEERYAQMDKKYKDDMKEAKRKKALALEQLQGRTEQEKENLMIDYKKHIATMKNEFSVEMDRVRSEAEMERAAVVMELRNRAERALTLSPQQEPDAETTTLFELRDHYLETVAKIKEDVMSHVQAANSRAANTMKTEMRKQRRQLVHVFKERCKASIRSILTGQVPADVLNSLEHSLDIIADAMATTPKSTKSESSPRTPRSSNEERYQTISTRQDRGETNFNDGRNTREARKYLHGNGMKLDEVDFQKANREGTQTLKNHPQLAKVDLYDSEATGSSPLISAQSSPASISPRTRSVVYNSNKKTVSDPQVPPLDFSPLAHMSQQMDYVTPISEGHRHHRQHSEDRSNNVRNGNRARPHSAESADDKSNSAMRQMSKSNFNEVGCKGNESEGDESYPSPRDKMKMIEARVRLAKWATSGEMPWKAQNSKTETEIRKQHDENNESTEEYVFVKPGKEAEEFVKGQRSLKRRDELVSPDKLEHRDRWSRQDHAGKNWEQNYSKHPQQRRIELDGYLTDNSSDSHSSFVTLEPDGHDDKSNRNQDAKEKEWTSYTSDYDRTKAAIFDKPTSTHTNVARRSEKDTGGVGMSFNDDASSVDSDAAPHFRTLPTSTPAKNDHHHRHKRTEQNTRSLPTKHSRNGNKEQDSQSQEWKTIDPPANYPDYKAYPREKQSHPYSSSGKTVLSKKSNDVTKSVNFEFPDLSGITQVSEDVRCGSGMWRYKSLDDLLPNANKARQQGKDVLSKRGEKAYSENRSNHGRDVDRNLYSSKSRKEEEEWLMAKRVPIQAMDSDFWGRQSLEDDDSDNKELESSYLHSHQPSQHRKPQRLYEEEDDDDNNNNYSPYSRQVQQNRQQMTNTLSEPSWSKKQHKRNPVDPSRSSYHSSKTTSQGRNRSISPAAPSRTQTMSKTAYSPQFKAHVDDLRKSLETMETSNLFSSNLNPHARAKGKSKMKRSVSEQSLHTIQWDHDQTADIDELVSAYTSDGGEKSRRFDLHNFGNEDAF